MSVMILNDEEVNEPTISFGECVTLGKISIPVLKGEQGVQGMQGIQGVAGERGEKGEKGDKGDKGDAGTTDYNDLENKPDLSVFVTEADLNDKLGSIESLLAEV